MSPSQMITARTKAFFLGAVVVMTIVTATLILTRPTARTPSESDPPRCGTMITVESSPEKSRVMEKVAADFEVSHSGCYQVAVKSVNSGDTLAALSAPDTPAQSRPQVWTPASTMWLSALAQRTGRAGYDAYGSVTQTPLVLAMPKPVAVKLGWPEQAISWATILELTQSQERWDRISDGRWGAFKLGKTNPHLSTSGLAALLTEYAALSTHDPGTITEADVADPVLQAKLEALENATIHYGETTLHYLCQLAVADRAGEERLLGYVTVVPVEEKSVFDYNTGAQTGCESDAPRVPLVPVQPADGTILSDSPYALLPGASEDQTSLARMFFNWLRAPQQQQEFTAAGFRDVTSNDLHPEVAKNFGPGRVSASVRVPDGAVLDAVLGSWERIRKPAELLLVVDVSQSMSWKMDEEKQPEPGERSRLDYVKDALLEAIQEDFGARDKVGMWTFSGDQTTDEVPYREIVPPGPIGATRPKLADAVRAMAPENATALYLTTAKAHEYLAKNSDRSSIRAVIVLTDGQDSYKNDVYKETQLRKAISADDVDNPVRVFTVGYGADSKMSEQLSIIASVSGGVSYTAADRRTIRAILREVTSNF